MKKSSKVLLSLGMASMCALPLLLTGCNASSEEIGKIAIASARNYVERHSEYEDYKDTTYKVNYEMQSKSKHTLTYKKKATDEEYTEGEFTNVESYGNSTTISIKNKDKEDLALYVKVVNTEKGSGYERDEEDETLVKFNEKWVGTTEYILSFDKDEEGNKVYYVINTYQSISNGEKSEKEVYYKTVERADYISYITNFIDRTKKCSINSYFFTSSMGEASEMMAMFLDYSENNGKVTCKIEAGMPMVGFDGDNNLQTVYYDYYISSSYSKSGLDTVKAKMYSSNETGENLAKIEMKVSGSASGTFKVPNLEEAEEMSGSFDPETVYIPSSIMEVMGD